MSDRDTDYLAVISIAGGMGSWARDPDKDEAIKRVARIFRQDFDKIVRFKKGMTINIDVLDVAGHDKVWWDARGFYTKNDKPFSGPVEVIEHTYRR